MELTELRKLVRLMLRADLSEVEIDDSNRGLRVHLKRGSSGSPSEAAVAPVVQVMPSVGGAPAPGLIWMKVLASSPRCAPVRHE